MILDKKLYKYVPIINILWQLLAGYRFTKSKEHESGLKVVETLKEVFSTGIKTSLFPMWVCKVLQNFYDEYNFL